MEAAQSDGLGRDAAIIMRAWKKLILWGISGRMVNRAADRLFDLWLRADTRSFAKNNCGNRKYFDYEPTSVLSIWYLFWKYDVRNTACLVDCGCGRGRILILGLLMGAPSVIGIEIDERLYRSANENLSRLAAKGQLPPHRWRVIHQDVLTADCLDDGTAFFLFNPFDYDSFSRFFQRLCVSHERNPREITVFLAGNRSSAERWVAEQSDFVWLEKRDRPMVAVLRRAAQTIETPDKKGACPCE